jgi:hypothetical protein
MDELGTAVVAEGDAWPLSAKQPGIQGSERT